MHQSRASNSGGYRIKKQKNNFLGDPNSREEEEFFKMSIHSSTQKSPGKGSGNKKRNNSVANRHNDYEKFSYRSRNSNVTKGNLSSSSLSGSNKKKDDQTGQIKQFTNVKQLLMIKAYDKKLFRKVTGSNEANKNFLRLGDVRNDPFRKETFKVMIENFKQITIRIRKGYEKVLSKILFQNTNTSAIVTLANVQPLLEKVRQQADIMHYKVKECLQTHDSREFRSLLIKFQTFLTASEEIEQIILIVSQSKNRIDDLFKNLEKDNHIDDKVNHERKKGIKKVRNAVRDYGDDCVEAKILDKVQLAINEMADKTLQAYSKINGARGIMMRIKECLKQNKDFYSLEDIVRLNKIFKEVLVEAESYERFTEKFMQEGDIINDDLRQCILRYKQEVETNKAAVYSMELKFVSNIIETSIQNFEANYSVCNAIDSNMSEDHEKVHNLLQSVCGCISDQTTKVTIRAMSRDVSNQFKNVEKLVKKLQRIPKSIALDTESGLQNLSKASNLIDEYKKNVREIMDRQDRAHRQITKKRVHRQIIDEVDLQQKSIADMIELSKKLSDPDRMQRISRCKAFHDVKQSMSVSQLASQIGDIKFYNEFKKLQHQIQHLCHNNQLSSLIQDLKTQNTIFELSPLFVQLHQIATSVTENNLLKSLQNLNGKGFSKVSTVWMVQCFIERIYAVVILKGLDKKTIKKIDDSRQIQFPENQHDVEALKRDVKYLKTVSSLMPEVLVKDRITLSFITMEQLIEGIKITEDLKWNKDGLCYLQNTIVFKVIQQAFERCFRYKQKVELDEVTKKLKSIGQNLDKMGKKEKNSGFNETRTQKVSQIIKKYEQINSKMIENILKIEKLQILEGYSQLVLCCCQYLKATLQSFYATLNKTNNVFWLCSETNQNAKFSPFGISIGLSQLKTGELTQSFNQKAGIKARKQVPKPKVEPIKQQKKKVKEDDEMGQEIEQNQPGDDIEDEMGQEINDQQIEDMDQDLQQQMEDNVEEMDEEMRDEVPDEESMDEEMIVEADENIIDDFESAEVVKKNKSRPSAAKNKDHTINTTSKPQTTLNNSNPAKNSIEGVHKKQESQIIFIKQKKAKFILQIFKYIETLQDLAELLKKIDSFRLNFWHSVDVKILEAYFNRDNQNEIEKVLIQESQKFCKAQFPAEFILSIRDSESYKKIAKQIEELNLLKFAVLSQILTLIGKNYGCLMGVKKQLLRLSIQSLHQWQQTDCVESYIKKELTLAGIKEEDYDKESYLEQLLKSKKGKQVRYELGDRNLQLKGDELKENVKQCEAVIKQYEDYAKFPDGLNLHETIVKMWHNCISEQGQAVDIKMPDKFYEDRKKLSIMDNFACGIYYVKTLRNQANVTMEHMQKHEKNVNSVLGKISADTLLQSINQLIKIYKCESGKVILFQEKPVMYRCSSPKAEQKYKIIEKYLIPESPSVNRLSSEQLRNRVKQNPEEYAKFGHSINRILSLLQIQCHIWPSTSALYIAETRDEILRTIISQISSGLIKDPFEELENFQEVNNCVKTISKQNLIFQYSIKEDSLIMNVEANTSYYNQFKKVMKEYGEKVSSKLEVSDTIFQNLFGFEDAQDSATSQIFEYTQTLSLILKEKLFVEKWETIFSFHIPTSNKIEELKKNIDSQVRLLLSIVEDPIDVNATELDKSLTEMESKNRLVLKWYDQHRSKTKSTLKSIKLCPCSGSCDKQYALYVGQANNHLEDYIRKLSSSSLLSQQIKKNVKKGTESEWKQSTTLHLGKVVRSVCDQLSRTDIELFKDFIHQYNLVHIIRKEMKNRQLADIHSKLVKLNSGKLEMARVVTQLVMKIKHNPALTSMMNEMIQATCGMELPELIKNNQEEKNKLAQISIDKTEYTKFGNWVVHIAGKIYKLPFYILLDIENKNDVVCIMTGKTDDDVKKELRNLQLPTEFTVIEQKHSYKKIHLNQQYFTIKLDEKELQKQELAQLNSFNFGIRPVQRQDDQKQTWLLGVYRKTNFDAEEDQYLLLMVMFNQQLLTVHKKIQFNINQFETKADIELKILEISYVQGGIINSNNIIREIKSEVHKGVNLHESIVVTAISRYLKAELANIKEKKRIEHQEKLLKEKRQKEQQEQRKRITAKAKADEEARQKQKQKQRQKENEAGFILQSQNEKSVTRQETDVFLDKLYEELVSKKVYTASKQKIKNRKQAVQVHLEVPKSSKNIQIKVETEKAIQKVEENLDQQVRGEFHKIAQSYLNCVVQFICYRDKILEQVLSAAKSTELSQINAAIQFQHMNKILEQIGSLQGYDPGLKEKITQILKSLGKQKQDILTSIYRMPN